MQKGEETSKLKGISKLNLSHAKFITNQITKTFLAKSISAGEHSLEINLRAKTMTNMIISKVVYISTMHYEEQRMTNPFIKNKVQLNKYIFQQ